MKFDDLAMIGVILAGVLIANRMANAAGNAPASGSSNARPTVGNNGTIRTADGQFYYDGSQWYQLTNGGFALIPGQ